MAVLTAGVRRRRVRGRSALRVRADGAVGVDAEPADRLGGALAGAGDAGRRSWPRRPPRPSSSSTTRRAASRTVAAATGWRWRSGIWPSVSSLAAAAAPPAGDVRRPDLRRRGRPPAHAPRARASRATWSASTRPTCSARRRRSVGEGRAPTALGLHRRDRQPPVDLRGVPRDVPARLVARAVAGHAAGVPPTRSGPRDVDPGVTKEAWDEELANVALFRAALPDGAPGAGQRPVADDLRRPRDHRRLEHRPRRGSTASTATRAGGGRSPTACSPTPCASTGGTSRPPSPTAGSPERRVLDAVSAAVTAPRREPGQRRCAPLLGLPAGPRPRRRPRRRCAT